MASRYSEMFSQGPHTDAGLTTVVTNRGVALLPDEAFSSALIKLQRMADSFLPMVPTLSLTGNLPHITLVQGRFKEATDFAQLLTEAVRRWSECGRQSLVATRIIYQPRGWIFLEIEHSSAIDGVHRGLADIAALSLVPPPEPAAERLADYSAQQRESFVRYGYRYMYDCFYPHVTLGRAEREPTQKELEFLNERAREMAVLTEFQVSKASVYEMGPKGAHASIVLSHRL